jgi:hypothetical protein
MFFIFIIISFSYFLLVVSVSCVLLALTSIFVVLLLLFLCGPLAWMFLRSWTSREHVIIINFDFNSILF